jgi:hypothetical protein
VGVLAHSTKSAQKDITTMTEPLSHSSMIFQKERDTHHHAPNSLDVGVNIFCDEALPKSNNKEITAGVDELILEEGKLGEDEVDGDQFFVNGQGDSSWL